MDRTLKKILENEMEEIRSTGLYKEEKIILTPQGSHVKLSELNDHIPKKMASGFTSVKTVTKDFMKTLEFINKVFNITA